MSNKEVVSAFVDKVINQRNADAIDDLVAEDFTRDDANSPYSSREEMKQAIAARRAFEGGSLKIDQMVAEGDHVAVRFSGSGKHVGRYRGIPASQAQVKSGGAAVVTLEGGKITRIDSIWDDLKLGRQLGVEVSLPSDF
jgi:steroid delta-isomerase-like uncharacterized protein